MIPHKKKIASKKQANIKIQIIFENDIPLLSQYFFPGGNGGSVTSLSRGCMGPFVVGNVRLLDSSGGIWLLLYSGVPTTPGWTFNIEAIPSPPKKNKTGKSPIIYFHFENHISKWIFSSLSCSCSDWLQY